MIYRNYTISDLSNKESNPVLDPDIKKSYFVGPFLDSDGYEIKRLNYINGEIKRVSKGDL